MFCLQCLKYKEGPEAAGVLLHIPGLELPGGGEAMTAVGKVVNLRGPEGGHSG